MSKIEKLNVINLTTVVNDSTNPFIKLNQEKQYTFILIANTITNALVNNIPPQEVLFNIVQIRGNFTSSALIHQCVKYSENIFFFCRKLFLAFFSSFIQSNLKKVKARCIKQKSKGNGPASARGGGVGASSDSTGSHSLSVSGILPWLEGRRWWWCRLRLGLQRYPQPLLFLPSMGLPKHLSLAFKLANSTFSLSVLKQDRTNI